MVREVRVWAEVSSNGLCALVFGAAPPFVFRVGFLDTNSAAIPSGLGHRILQALEITVHFLLFTFPCISAGVRACPVSQ